LPKRFWENEDLVEWTISHAPTDDEPLAPEDLHSSDAARFWEHQKTSAHVKARTAEGFNKTYGIVHPLEQWFLHDGPPDGAIELLKHRNREDKAERKVHQPRKKHDARHMKRANKTGAERGECDHETAPFWPEGTPSRTCL